MTDTTWVIIGTGLIAFAGAVFGLFKNIAASVSALKKELDPEIKAVRTEYISTCQKNYDLHEVKIESLRREMEQRVERVAVNESKARHDLNNAITGQLAKLELSVQRLGEQAVKKEDFNRVERLLETFISKQGDTAVLTQQVSDLSKRFDKFFDEVMVLRKQQGHD